MAYKVESDFEYDGYRCVIVFQKGGHRCGYVGIPQTHPFYGVNYSDKVDVLKFDNIKEQNIGKRGIIPVMCMAFEDSDDGCLRPDCYFDVHGGITYSDKGSYPVESDLWWFGFDCAHAGDRKDYKQVAEYGLDTPEHVQYNINLENEYYIEDEAIRTKEYVEQECRNLADQLKIFE